MLGRGEENLGGGEHILGMHDFCYILLFFFLSNSNLENFLFVEYNHIIKRVRS